MFKKRYGPKQKIGNTFENDVKELDTRKAYKYLGMEERHRRKC
jgi:hypothetical protein